MASNRREFFKQTLGVVGVVAAGQVTLQSLLTQKSWAAGTAENCDKLPFVEPGKGMAASVNYVVKHADLKDAKLKTERQGVKWDKQVCKGCMLFTACGKKGADEVGKCTLFNGQVVKASAWCSTWNKKA